MKAYDFYPCNIYLVVYLRHGEPDKMVTMDRVKAEAYAAQWGGTIEELYRKSEIEVSECTVEPSVAPWESQGSNGTTESDFVEIAEKRTPNV